jgi:hypothetical protein
MYHNRWEGQNIGAEVPSPNLHGRDPQCPLNLDSGPYSRRLRRNPRHHHPRHFRIEPANAVAPNDKVGRVENLALNEIQHRTIDLGPLGLQ